MNIKYYILLILLIFILIGGLYSTLKFKGPDEFSTMYKSLPFKLTCHIPDSLMTKGISSIAYGENDHRVLYIAIDLNSSKIDSIQSELTKISIASYQADDPNLLIVQSSFSADRYTFCIEGYSYPVPFFLRESFPLDVLFSQTKSGLDDSFSIYVLEAKQGKQWNRFPGEVDYMPEEWKKGLSKGIAISEKLNAIIYWSVIW